MSRILIVDDKPEALYLLRKLLEGHGYVVDEARHGAEALNQARDSRPQLVISDLLMPVMDGYTLLRHWKNDPQLKTVPFIVYTATYTGLQDEQLALDLGADAFIIKPAEPDPFMRRIRAVLSANPPGKAPIGDDRDQLAVYSEVLARKLEAKVVELEQARAQLRAVLDNIPDLVCSIDRSGSVIYTNRPPPSTSWLSYYPVELHGAMQAALTSALSTGENVRVEETTSGPDHTARSLSSYIGPVRFNDVVTGAVVVTCDVTEKKRTEAQLIASDRMASVGLLAAGIAHEINNPLAALVTNLELAHKQVSASVSRLGLPADLREELSDAVECAERIRTIVADLKIFSRAREEKRGPVDTRQVMESTLRMVWNEIRHRAALVKHYEVVPPVEANESRLGQVFLNLLVNATHAIGEGRADRNEIRVSTRLDPRGGVVVEVADTGIGMSEEVQRRLFTPFFTTKPVGVGTGLGLAICRRIITDLGGAIEVESELGKGTTFRVFLPAAATPPATRASTMSPAHAAQRRGRILVIEDEPLIGVVIGRSLSNEHEVITMTRADKALEHLSSGERFDLILCDLMMPEMTGMDFYAELSRRAPELAERMIFMTGGAFTPSAREFLDRVPNLSIEKPFGAEQLRALVNALIR